MRSRWVLFQCISFQDKIMNCTYFVLELAYLNLEDFLTACLYKDVVARSSQLPYNVK